MNAERSLHNFVLKQDATVAMALVQGIGNYALGQLISAATAQKYADDAKERDEENDNASVDQRNEKDDDDERAPPDGLEARETPTDRINRYAALYADCIDMADSFDAGEYDRPQDIASHVAWRAGRPAADVERIKRGSVSLEEALRLVANAKSQQAFWAKHKSDVIALCEDACVDATGEALMTLEGVDAVQAMVKGYAKLVDRIGNRKGSPYFTSKGEIGKTIRSDVGAMEAALERTEKFIDELETAYAPELLAAIEQGRNLHSIESAVEGVQLRMAERLKGLIAAVEETEAKTKKAETAEA
jgi:hypothetical protein